MVIVKLLKMMIKNLDNIRTQWEKGLEVKAVLGEKESGTIRVVLQDINELFHLHRYFKIGDIWNISTDLQSVLIDEIWENLGNG